MAVKQRVELGEKEKSIKDSCKTAQVTDSSQLRTVFNTDPTFSLLDSML